MHILLVEPHYYTRYPPVGLLKLSTYHKFSGDTTELIKGCKPILTKPDRIYVTSLFTWAWREVWEAVRYYKELFPDVELWLGGLYASLLPEHAAQSGADYIYKGLFKNAENLMPDYDLVPEWDGSIIFSSRGCNRKCPFCAVPILEGKVNSVRYSIKHLVYHKHTRIILWDNNILQSPGWRSVFDELEELGLKVDFNQGLDARLITDEVAERLSRLKLSSGRGIKVRLGYDRRSDGPSIKRAIDRLNAAEIEGRRIMIYTLYNYVDDPQDFLNRVREVLNWGAVCYPMRYEPLNGEHALKKNTYTSPNWTKEELEMIQDARRVLGYGGAWPPHDGLVNKFNRTHNFQKAFELRPIREVSGKDFIR